jgi:hypothetical protein
VPAPLAALAMRCLEKDPAARPARGHDLADALYAWLATQGGGDGAARVARPVA